MFGGPGLPWSMLCTLELLSTGTGGVTAELPAGLDISAKRQCSQTVPGRKGLVPQWPHQHPSPPAVLVPTVSFLHLSHTYFYTTERTAEKIKV